MERAGRKTLSSALDIISFKYFRVEMKIWVLIAYKMVRSTIVEPETSLKVNTNIWGKKELTDKPEMTRNGQSIMRRITWT